MYEIKFPTLIQATTKTDKHYLKPGIILPNDEANSMQPLSPKAQETLVVREATAALNFRLEQEKTALKLEAEERRQDAITKRENQRIELFLSEDGRPYQRISLLTEGDLQGTITNARFVSRHILKPANSHAAGVLFVKVVKDDECEEELWINLEKLTTSYLRKKICGTGIKLTCPPKKERVLLERLIALLRGKATEETVYQHRGWAKKADGEVKYVDETEVLWREVLKRAE